MQNLIFKQKLYVKKEFRTRLKNHKSCILWLTGLSGAGKSTIANLTELQLAGMGCHTYILDGDNIRYGLNSDLGFSDVDRKENIRRIAEVSKLFVDAGIITFASFISPFESDRRLARNLFQQNEFFEVFINTPLEVAEERDPKGLYAKARRGELKRFTGIDSEYQVPLNPDLVLDTVGHSPEECAQEIVKFLREKGIIQTSDAS